MRDSVNMTMDTLSNPFGTARLVSGARTIQRALDANVTPTQLKAIFSDLQDFDNEEIVGFAKISNGLIKGDISIQKSVFRDNLESNEQNSCPYPQTA